MENEKPLNYYLWITLVLLLAYLLRVVDIAHRSLWFDEAVEYLTATAPFELLPESVVRLNYQPPLTSFLLHNWSQITIHPLWLRYMTLTFSMFAIVGMILLTRIVVGHRASIIAGLVTAVMPTEIYYAQDVGEYSLLVCFVTWSLFFLYLSYETNRWRYWILWGLFCTLAMYTQYGAAIFFAPLAAFTFFYHIWFKRWSVVIRLSTVVVTVVIAILPLIFYFLPQQIRRVSDSAFANSFNGFYQEILQYFSGFGHIFTFNLVGWPFSPIPKWLGIGVLMLIAVLLIIIFPRCPKRPFLWLIAVYSFYFVLIRLGLYRPFGSRQSLFFTPFLILIIAIIFDQIWKRRSHILALLIVGIVISVEIYSSPHATMSMLLRNQSPWSPVEEMAGTIEYWQDNYQSHHKTFVHYGAVPAFRYYLQVNGLDSDTENDFNERCSLAERHSLCEQYNLVYSAWIRSLPNDEEAASILEQMGEDPEQFWLIFSHMNAPEQEEIMFYLQEKYQIVDKNNEVGASIYLLKRK